MNINQRGRYSGYEVQKMLKKLEKKTRSERRDSVRTEERYRIKDLPWWRRLTNKF